MAARPLWRCHQCRKVHTTNNRQRCANEECAHVRCPRCSVYYGFGLWCSIGKTHWLAGRRAPPGPPGPQGPTEVGEGAEGGSRAGSGTG